MLNDLQIMVIIDGVRHYLDLTGTDTCPLNYNVEDITDISKVNGAWSKSILVPANKHNIAVFNNKQDPNSSSVFDPNELNRASIIVNSILVLEGNFVMKEITLNEYNYSRWFSLDISGDSIDIYQRWGDKELQTLTGLDNFDHVWNTTNLVIAQAATSSYKVGYDYPMIDYGYDWTIPSLQSTGAILDQFKPAAYARVLWDRCISEEGYAWISNSLTQSTPLDRLILPFTSKEMLHTDDYLNERIFRVGIATFQNVVSTSTYPKDIWQAYAPGYNQWSWWPTGAPWQQTILTQVQYTDESSPNGDPNNLYNTVLFTYTNTSAYPITQRFGFNFEIDQQRLWKYQDQPRLELYIGNGQVQICEQWTNSLDLPVVDNGVNGNNIWTYTNAQAYGTVGGWEKFVGKFKSPLLTVFPGQTVTVKYRYILEGNFVVPVPAGTVLAVFKAPNTYWWNEPEKKVLPGDLITFTDILPKKFKRKDFMLSIIKKFNLIVEQDKLDPKLLRIETRDYYYATGSIITNWQSKIDFKQPIKQKVLGDAGTARVIFKDKDDSDYFNKDYKAKIGQTYGQEIYLTGNENVKADKTIETHFSPTPMVAIPYASGFGTTNSSTLTIPKIGSVNGNKFEAAQCNPRILLRVPQYPCPQDPWIFQGLIGLRTTYAYAGHVDDPNYPTEDINFGQNLGLYYPQSNVTSNNLVNKYWRKQLDEIYDKDSLIITAQMNLNPVDIATFRFNSKIYLDFGTGFQYYRVNKIEQYDPVKRQSCSVEFIKVREISVPKLVTSIRKPIPTGIAVPGGVKWTGGGPSGRAAGGGGGNDGGGNSGTGLAFGDGAFFMGEGSMVVGGSSSVIGNNSMVIGEGSKSNSSSTFIQGDNSTIAPLAPNNTIIGDDSSIASFVESSFIIGNNSQIINNTGATISNSFAIGNNITIESSDTFVIGAKLVVGYSDIDGGSDITISPFSDIPYTDIDGGSDCLLPLGNITNITDIDGGSDNVL